jgi:hypothetical protein
MPPSCRWRSLHVLLGSHPACRSTPACKHPHIATPFLSACCGSERCFYETALLLCLSMCICRRHGSLITLCTSKVWLTRIDYYYYYYYYYYCYCVRPGCGGAPVHTGNAPYIRHRCTVASHWCTASCQTHMNMHSCCRHCCCLKRCHYPPQTIGHACWSCRVKAASAQLTGCRCSTASCIIICIMIMDSRRLYRAGVPY